MFYIRPTLVFADSTTGGVFVVSNTETEKKPKPSFRTKNRTEPEVAILEPNQPY